jgi:hypothetical protein
MFAQEGVVSSSAIGGWSKAFGKLHRRIGHRFCRSQARDGLVVARDARRIRQVGECLPTPRAVGEAGLVGAYPPSVRRERSSGTGDEGA